MKISLLLSALLATGTLLALAGDAPKPAADATGTNSPVKPDIKVIFAKETFFTNAAGLVIQKISPSLWVSRTEVTQEAYKKVAGGNPSAFAGDENPVENVSWTAAVAFCQSLTAYEAKETMLPAGFAYWLPTQEQWESFAAGTSLDLAVTGSKGPRKSTAPAGSLGANALNLSDVRGNVMEWTADRNATYDYRVARGAAWDTWIEVNLRPEFRVFKSPNDAANNIGFRVVLIPEGEAKGK